MGRVQHRKTAAISSLSTTTAYSPFDQLDGWHEWQDVVPEACVLYPARKLHEGRVIYFNFALAKEMGLIDANHPHVLNKKLEEKILETFSIRIINEYDQKQNIRYHPRMLKKNKYMATRYLQLQHKNKRGTTSGDGRSVWNGQFTHNGVVWDVSSRGTGVTCLAPGAVEAKKPLKSGSTSFGYGCGMADIDELVGAAIMAEIFHNNGINTERVLTVIDNGAGNGIGVRAGKNLFRPAHLFLYLKQGNYTALKKATDFLIERQCKNGEWQIPQGSKKKYELMLSEIAESFARFAALLDRDYIFAWLDWDGDNVLANAGIIDYGSIRQFGLRHDEYRYDDVDRYSTNMQEQMKMARQTVQTFAQLTDFLSTGEKKPISQFASHSSLSEFDSHFSYFVLDRFLQQMGLGRLRREYILKSNRNLIESLYSDYSYLERVKTKRKKIRVPDGINRPAILNMRKILYLLPEHLYLTLMSGEIEMLSSHDFFRLILAESAKGKDRKLSKSIERRIQSFQMKYWETLARVSGESGMKALLSGVIDATYKQHGTRRLTGDGLLYVVDELLKFNKKSKRPKELQPLIDQIIQDHSLSTLNEEHRQIHRVGKNAKNVLKTMLTLVDDMKESI